MSVVMVDAIITRITFTKLKGFAFGSRPFKESNLHSNPLHSYKLKSSCVK